MFSYLCCMQNVVTHVVVGHLWDFSFLLSLPAYLLSFKHNFSLTSCFHCETNLRANSVQIPVFFSSSSFETLCLIPPLVLYIKTILHLSSAREGSAPLMWFVLLNYLARQMSEMCWIMNTGKGKEELNPGR